MSKTHFSPKTAFFAAAIASLTLVAAAASAQAAPAQTLPQVAVTYADLNLGTQKGQHILTARIENAAHQVCGSAPDMRALPEARRYSQCVADSMARAAAAITVPEVRTALETKLTNRAGS